jgi:hypothetical protein
MPLTYINFQSLSQKTAKKLDQNLIHKQLLRLESAITQLDQNLNSKLLLETLLLDWPVIT